MTTPITLPIPYADLVAPLTWQQCRQLTDAYQAACVARCPTQWSKPSDETLTFWAFAEAAELAVAARNALTFDLGAPLVGDCLDAIAHVIKEKADVMFVARQIDDPFLLDMCLVTFSHKPHTGLLRTPEVRAAFRLVARDNLRRIETATIAPDGKMIKSIQYDTAQVYTWIGEVIRLGEAANT